MSQTVSMEAAGRSYWAYVASAMVQGLTEILDQQAEPGVVPQRVYADAQEFFRVALEAADDTVPRNPSASIANYIIAADAARSGELGAPREALRDRLKLYSDLIGRLQQGQRPTANDRQAAADLKVFFANLQHEAEVEAYDTVVEVETPRMNLRMI